MEKKKLEFFIDMPIKSYNFTAYMGGVLFANNQLWRPYYLSKHILLSCNDLFDVICDDMIMYEDEDVFERKKFHFEVEEVVELRADLISKIDEEFYASVTVDEMYISCRKAFNTKSFYHDLLIFGYDLNKNIFYTAGYDDTGYFSCKEHDIDVVVASILSCLKGRKSKPHCHYFRSKSQYMDFSLGEVKNTLEKYLLSEPVNQQSYHGEYGLLAYKKLIEKHTSATKEGKMLRRATFSMLLEHKKLMVERVNYINTNCVKIDLETINMFEKIVELTKILQLHSIKHEVTGSEKIGLGMIKKIEAIAELERLAISELVEQI